MAGPYREKIFGVLVKIETTSGVDSVPTAGANAIRIVGGIPSLEWNFMDAGERQDAQTGILSAAPRAAPAGKWGRIAITVDLKGANAVYSASVKPEADALWRMSGFLVASDFTGGAELYSYTTLDSGMETATVYLYGEGKLYKMVGCVAAPTWSAEVYKEGRATFTIQGRITSVTEAALPALTLSSVIPQKFHSSTVSIGSWNGTTSGDPLVLISARGDMGTTIASLDSAGATDGLAGWLITDRNVSEEFVFNIPALATFDPFTLSGADGSSPLLTAFTVGQSQYNKVLIEGRWSPRAPRLGSRNGVRTVTQSGQCVVGTGLLGGREIQITYK